MSVKKNFIYNLSYQLLTMVLPIITTPYIARVIGADGIGIQSYTYSIVSYFVLFAMLGVNNYGNRSIAMVRDSKEKLSKTFISIYIVQAIMSLIMIFLYSIYIIFIVDTYKMFFVIQAIYIIGALLDINWFFFGIEKFKLTVIRNTIIRLTTVFAMFVFVRNSSDIYIYSLILAISNLLSQVVLWKFIGEYICFTSVRSEDILEHVKPMLVLFIPVISVSLYKVMDKIMLGAISSVTQVGFYENSEKLINIPLGVITALATVMLPKMSNLQAKYDEKESKKYILLSIEFVMIIGFGSMFGLIGISNILIPMFLGSGFNGCINVVSLLSITILFVGWANVIRTQFLIPRRKDKIYIISTFLGAFVNIVVNILLIKKYGAIGAAIGTILAEISVAVYQTIMVRKELEIKEYFKRTIFYIIPGIIMCLVVKYIGHVLGESIFTCIVQVIVGGSIYSIISLVYMVIIKSELVTNILKKSHK